jgi:hypothetical protein
MGRSHQHLTLRHASWSPVSFFKTTAGETGLFVKTIIGNKEFRVKRHEDNANRFYYWSPKALRWIPVAKAKVIFRAFSKVTEALLHQAANDDDCDGALSLIQNAIGIDSGDVAGVFFSGMDLRATWPLMPVETRLPLLRRYVEREFMYES